jgi:hypothetical protein
MQGVSYLTALIHQMTGNSYLLPVKVSIQLS